MSRLMLFILKTRQKKNIRKTTSQKCILKPRLRFKNLPPIAYMSGLLRTQGRVTFFLVDDERYFFLILICSNIRL